jgi:5'-3' exonuclease
VAPPATADSPSTVYLIDASPYIFRAYFSLPSSMVSPAGEPVGAVYGFASFLAKLLEDEAPTHLGIAFDGSLTTSFRNEFYPAYKAQRELPPPELLAQLPACYELAAALGGASFIDRRYEADDLVGTLSRSLAAAGHRSVVVTSDKDLAQLVGERVTLYDFAKGLRYGPREVEEKFGVAPRQVPDLLGLAGDAVDNIPGVPGIGAKTAAALLAHFGSLDALYDRLGEVEALPLRGARGIAARLAGAREQAFLSRRLATIATDAPVAADLVELRLGDAEPAGLDALLTRLGFSGLRDRLLRTTGHA